MLTHAQARMARAALSWTLRELEKKSGVNKNTIGRYESGSQILSGAIEAMERAFLAAGLELLGDEKGFGVGVRIPARLESRVNAKAANAPRPTRRKRTTD